MILLRSIAEIAREEGEDLNAPEAAFACVEVFALGGQGAGRARSRAAISRSGPRSPSRSPTARASSPRRGSAALPAPVVARLISQIASRFGIVVSEKVAAQAAPILGAIGGAAVNAAFADHFQTLARGHFIVRRLERQHGASVVAFEYQRLQGEREHAQRKAEGPRLKRSGGRVRRRRTRAGMARRDGRHRTGALRLMDQAVKPTPRAMPSPGAGGGRVRSSPSSLCRHTPT